MKYLISNENIKIPNMIYGTAWKKQNTNSLVKDAILNGFRGIDTACQPKHYQEDLVGKGISEAKESVDCNDLFLQTKFTPIAGQDRLDMPYSEYDLLEVQIEKSFNVSKKNLNTNFIHSYLLHSPMFPLNNLINAWEIMSSFYKNKEVGQLGISNCYDLDTLAYLYDSVEIKPAVIQNRFYSQSHYDKELRRWCKERGIIYQGFWTLTANPHILQSNQVINLTKKYNVSEAMIFYKFLNSIDIIPLNGTTSTIHMQEDLKLSDFDLTEEEINSLNLML